MGIINVWLLSKEKVSNFIFSIITVLSYLYIYYQTGLYALCVLSIFQVGFNIFGWYYWIKNQGEDDSVVTSGLSNKVYIIWIIIILLAWSVCGYIELNVLNANNAILDSLTAVLGLVAQYWLSKKLYENWILWIISNLAFMAIYNKWMQVDSNFSLYISRLIAQRNYDSCVREITNAIYPLRYRTIYFIYNTLSKNNLVITKDLIVEGLGSNIRSINRILKQLIDENIIKYKSGTIYIESMDKLKRELDDYRNNEI